MTLYKRLARYAAVITAACLLASGCQKFDRPDAGDYPHDSNPPGGPLNLYLAFDGTSTDPAMNAVDSIRATFPADNPLTSTDGISGKAIKGENKKFVKFSKPNDWITASQSFTVAFWYKHDGQTHNNTGTNGPEFVFSAKTSTDDHWSGGNTFLLLEGSNTACAVKLFAVDKDANENWFAWENANMVAGLMDNAWHQLVFSYDASTSKMTMYKDAVANPVVLSWGTHGAAKLNNSIITEFRIGGGPGTSYDTDDWLSSTWKGNLDQFRLYSKALSAADVSALFASKL